MILGNFAVVTTGAVMGFLLKTFVVFLGGASSATAGLLDVEDVISELATLVLAGDLAAGDVLALLGPLALSMTEVLLELEGLFKRTTFVPEVFFFKIVVTVVFGVDLGTDLEEVAAAFEETERGFV